MRLSTFKAEGRGFEPHRPLQIPKLRRDATPRKTVPFDGDAIKKLPNDKPVVYRIFTQEGKNN